jgi:hypothetical protein
MARPNDRLWVDGGEYRVYELRGRFCRGTPRRAAEEVRFAEDSPLEEAGFEPSVPHARNKRFVRPCIAQFSQGK